MLNLYYKVQFYLNEIRSIGAILPVLFALNAILPQVSHAQATMINIDFNQAYYEAKQRFAEGNYALSYPIFKDTEQKLLNGWMPDKSLQYDEVIYYTIACELMQGNVAAERNAQTYLAGNNNKNYKGQLGFFLGRYYFKNGNHEKATEAFAFTDATLLTEVQKNDLQFEYGYSLLTLKKFAEAKEQFNEARLKPGNPRYMDANYYYGLLAYNDRNYKEAVRSFEIAGESEKYKPLAPYYSASIQYALGNKDKGLELAEKALQQGNQYYEAELYQLIGHAYFEKGNYAKALPYLEKFVARTPKVKREDLYELAYCYYKEKNWEKAIDGFKPLSDGKDSLTQHAMYLLGDAYLKTNDKANAKTAFTYCAANSSNPRIKENSMFHAGKLSFDLGLDNEAAITLKKFIQDYPKSSYNAEARELLIASLANTSNYSEALSLYEGLKEKSAGTRKIFPRLLFNRAQELINDRRLDEASILLDKAMAAPDNSDVLPLLNYWKGELAYFNKNYSAAVVFMEAYLDKPISAGEANPDNAMYTLGYCLLNTEKYAQAEKTFDGLTKVKFANAAQNDDVQLRLADACYMQKNFGKAKPVYTRYADRAGDFADYASYQLAMIAGAENKPAQKISFLQNIDKQYQGSVLVPVANLAIATTYMEDEKYKDALPWLIKVINGKGGEQQKPEALLKQGLAYYNIDNSTEALNSFKTLLNRYGESEEADEAIDNVRSIFIEQGKPEAFVAFMNAAGRGLDKNTADSLSFVAAEMQMSEGKKDKALTGFEEYLKNYPEGRYKLQASWFAAEIHREKKDMVRAMVYYESLIKLAPNKYAEGAMVQAARYYYFEKKEYAKASGFYSQLKETASSQENKLEAMRGIVRCQYYSGAYSDASSTATELLAQSGIGTDDKVFANLVLGKQTAEKSNCTDAIKYYEQVANLNKAEYGAEARYGIAACYYKDGKWEDAENAAFDVVKKSGSYALWVTRSYILLGDIYWKQKDYFNAKATFKSVAENATIADLKKEASEKLAKVEKEEREQSKITQ